MALDYDNYEVIVVDDRSTDRTGEIIERVAAITAGSRLSESNPYKGTAAQLAGQDSRHVGCRRTGDRGLAALLTDADVLFKPEVVRRASGHRGRNNRKARKCNRP